MIAHNLTDREYLALNGTLSLDRIERLLDRTDELEKMYDKLTDMEHLPDTEDWLDEQGRRGLGLKQLLEEYDEKVTEWFDNFREVIGW